MITETTGLGDKDPSAAAAGIFRGKKILYTVLSENYIRALDRNLSVLSIRPRTRSKAVTISGNVDFPDSVAR